MLWYEELNGNMWVVWWSWSFWLVHLGHTHGPWPRDVKVFDKQLRTAIICSTNNCFSRAKSSPPKFSNGPFLALQESSQPRSLSPPGSSDLRLHDAGRQSILPVFPSLPPPFKTCARQKAEFRSGEVLKAHRSSLLWRVGRKGSPSSPGPWMLWCVCVCVCAHSA